MTQASQVFSGSGKLWIVSTYRSMVRSVASISVRVNGDVSVGLANQQAKIQKMIFTGSDGRNIIDFEETFPAEALIDPHFTYHHPNYFHLRANKKPVLLKALVWTKHESHAECSPWLRLVSSPVSSLRSFTPQGKPHWLLPLPSEDCSLGLWFDFVNQVDTCADKTARYVVTAKETVVRVRVATVSAQEAAMNYLIQG